MNKQKVLNLLGLAKRAGELTTGEELVIKEVQKQRAEVLFVASNASENTRKKMRDKSSYYEVAIDFSFSHEELSHAIGESRKVIALMDKGFAKKIKELLNE